MVPLNPKLDTDVAIFCRKDFEFAVIEKPFTRGGISCKELTLNLEAVTRLNEKLNLEIENLEHELLNQNNFHP